MANRGSSLAGFPVLEIDNEDVSGSWKRWLDEFVICAELKELDMGFDYDGNARFGDRQRTLALLRGIGEKGREVLRSRGFDIANPRARGDRALELLDEHFNRQESVFVKTQKFVTVKQLASEDERDYLHRVERLSRYCEFGVSAEPQVAAQIETTRQRFCVVLAILGLTDDKVKTELLARTDLTWAQLRELLDARARALCEKQVLSGAVKKEVSAVDAKSSKPTERESDSSSRTYEEPGEAQTSRGPNPDDYEGRGRRTSHRRDGYSSRSSSRDSRDRRSSYRRRRGNGDPRRSRSRDRYSDRRSDRYEKRRDSPRDEYKRGSYSKKGRGQYDYRSSDSGSDRDYAYGYRSGRGYQSSDSSGSRKGSEKCYECKRKGHTARYCPDVQCFKCQGYGHQVRDCRQRDCWTCGGRGHTAEGCPNASRRRRSPSPGRRVQFVNKRRN